MSISVITAQDLTRTGANSFDRYATSVPNLSFGYVGEGRQTSRQFQIRGIFGRETSALYIDDTPVPTTMDPRVVDLERIEVLRGPQGSLFGARSMGGLVRLITRKPDPTDLSGYGHVSVGTIHEGAADAQLDGGINIPLIQDRLAIRSTAYYIRDGGFIDRLIDPDRKPNSGDEHLHKNINEDRTWGVQTALLWRLSDAISFTPSIMYQRLSSDGPPFVDGRENNLVKVRRFDVSESNHGHFLLASGTLNIDTGKGSITSSTSYFNRRTRDIEDSTAFHDIRGFLSTAPSLTTKYSNNHEFTEELRFASSFGHWIELIAGGFYQHRNNGSGFLPPTLFTPGSAFLSLIPGLMPGDTVFAQIGKTRTKEFGAFGEIELKPLDGVTLTVGGRYYDLSLFQSTANGGFFVGAKNSFLPTVAGRQSEHGVIPKATIRYEFAPDSSVYATVSQGFRPGGTNPNVAACAAKGAAVPAGFSSDKLTNYEVGTKASFFGHAVTVNAAAFDIEWDNLQVNLTCAGTGFGFIDNVGAARSRGAELEMFLRPFDGLQMNLGLGYTDAKITDAGGAKDIKVGDRLANVPTLNYSISADYERPLTDSLDGFARIDFRSVGKSRTFNAGPRPGYDTLDMTAGLKFGRFTYSVFARNLTDARGNLSVSLPLAAGQLDNFIAITRPRTIGFDVRAEF